MRVLGRAGECVVFAIFVVACTPAGAPAPTGSPAATVTVATTAPPPVATAAPSAIPTAAPAATTTAAALDASKWPLPQECNPTDCKLADGTPGVKCGDGGACANPCPAGMAPEHQGTYCAKLCKSKADCGGDPCSPEGICNRWPKPLACDGGEVCDLPGGVATGVRCSPKDRCQSPCKRGHVLYGGTHCAKPCKSDKDCPGGDCSEGICGPLCPSEGCPYRWE